MKVELMGGRLTVSSRENVGSTFTFILPYKVSNTCDSSDDADEISDISSDAPSDDATESYFQFQPRTLGSLFKPNGTSRTPKLLQNKIAHKLSGLPNNSYSFPFSNNIEKELFSTDDDCSVVSITDTLSETERHVITSPDIGTQSSDQLENHRSDTREMDISPKLNEIEPTCDEKVQEKCNSNTEQISRTEGEEANTVSEPKILVVEDNKINVMVVQSMMKRLGHSVDVVSNGVEAVKAVQRCSYDIVLMVIILSTAFLFLICFFDY